MEGRRRRGAVDRDDVHAGQHLVEALPVGRLQLVLDGGQHALAVVVVDRQAEGLGAARHRGADAAHADDAEPLAPDAPAEHPGRRPAGPFAVVGQCVGAFDQPARHGENQPHRHVGRVFGQHVRRVGDGDAFLAGRSDVDVVDAVAEIGDQLEVFAGSGDQRLVYPVGDGRHQHVGFLHRRRQLLARHRLVVDVQARVEQLAHARLDRVRQFARDDDERLFLAGHSSLGFWASDPFPLQTSLTKTGETGNRPRHGCLCNKRFCR